MKKYIILFLLGLTITINAQPLLDSTIVKKGSLMMQTNLRVSDYNPQVIPQSPQSMLFKKYLDHPISNSNGLPEIEIPLYEIELDGLKIPINLNYHPSGIQYGQYDGDVGVGWTINASGYRVTRTINGYADETRPIVDTLDYEKAKRHNAYPPGEYYLSNLDKFLSGFDKNSTLNMSTSREDGEYDVFSYMLPSTNGEFVIINREDMQVLTAGVNNDRILIKSKSINGFEIVDDKGFTYHLGTLESGDVSFEHNGHAGGCTGWALRKIVSPHGNEIIFKYRKASELISHNFASLYATEAHIGTPNKFLPNSTADIQRTYPQEKDNQLSTFYLTEIICQNEKIKFERNKINQNDFQLNAILIESPFLQRKISLRYLESDESNWHRQLLSVSITASDIAEQNYKFEYYPAPAKGRKETYPDQWGYYTNTYFTKSNVSDNLFLHEGFKDDIILYNVDTGDGSYPSPTGTRRKLGEVSNPYHWVNRTKTKDIPNYFSLKKIIYPTGGSVEYIYGMNLELGISGPEKRSGLRTDSIKYRERDESLPIKTVVYKYGENENGTGVSALSISERNFVDYEYNFHFVGPEYLPEATFYATVQRTRTYNVNGGGANDRVTYKHVAEYIVSDNEDIGHTEYKYVTISNTKEGAYSLPWLYLGNMQPEYDDFYKGEGLSFMHNERLGIRTYLDSKKIYNSKKKLLIEEKYSYKKINIKRLPNLIARQIVRSERSPNLHDIWGPYEFFNSLFKYTWYNIYLEKNILTDKKTIEYFGEDPVVKYEMYKYDSLDRVIELEVRDDEKSIFKEKYTYPTKNEELYRKNMLSTIKKKIKEKNGKIIYVVDNVYSPTSFLPEKVNTTISAISDYVTEVTYDKYDTKSNILQYTSKDGVPISYLWSYNGQYPIAEIKNATYAEVVTALQKQSKTVDGLSAMITPSWDTAKFRTDLPNALISTYTYKPLVGILTATDPSGKTIHYGYDSFGRLKESYLIENNTKKVLEAYDYNYKQK